MKIQYTTRFEDFTEFMIFHHTRPQGMKRVLLRQIAIVILFSCAITGVLYFLSSMKNDYYFLRFALVIIPLFMISQYMSYKRYPEKIRAEMPRYLKGADRTAFSGEHELEILNDGIIERPSGEKTAWSGIRDVVTTDAHTFIYITESRAHVIPRSGVKNSVYNYFLKELESRRGAVKG
jgi:hypothetical protein